MYWNYCVEDERSVVSHAASWHQLPTHTSLVSIGQSKLKLWSGDARHTHAHVPANFSITITVFCWKPNKNYVRQSMMSVSSMLSITSSYLTIHLFMMKSGPTFFFHLTLYYWGQGYNLYFIIFNSVNQLWSNSFNKQNWDRCIHKLET